jgi:hypothetical protein
VILEHRPGELARLAEITGEAGVTVHGLAAFTGEGRGVVHVLLDDEAVAGCRAALERAGMGIADEREVFVIDVQDRPAALGELTRQLAQANVNVDLAYTHVHGREDRDCHRRRGKRSRRAPVGRASCCIRGLVLAACRQEENMSPLPVTHWVWSQGQDVTRPPGERARRSSP